MKSFKVPFYFRWLRRSRKPIMIADQLGRVDFFRPSHNTFKSIGDFFENDVYIPKIFVDISAIPARLPDRMLRPLRSSQRIPAIFFPPCIDSETFLLVCECLNQAKLRILIGTPLFNRQLVFSHLMTGKTLKFNKITSDHFTGLGVKESSRRNFPYIVGFLKFKF